MKIGFFGKLPGYGDFIQRNVPPNVADKWDNWILQSIESSRNNLDSGWKEIYFNSPIWRFSFAANILANECISGLMMPSVDSAGRCYPFTVFCLAEKPVNLLKFSAITDDKHDSCEDFIISLLDKKRPDLDEIAQILNQTYKQTSEYECEATKDSQTSSSREIFRVSSKHLLDVYDCHLDFSHELIDRQALSLSIWSTRESEFSDAQRRYYAGLPPSDVYSSLLTAE